MISNEEYEQALEAAERHLLARGSGKAVSKIGHAGSVSRDAEFHNMSIKDLKDHIRWLERKLGRGTTTRSPMYP